MEKLLMTTKYLNQIDLSRRWRISPRTLERWRWRRQGPTFSKLGGRVVYDIADVEAFERAGRRNPVASPSKHAA
jgi:hypothetical protein